MTLKTMSTCPFKVGDRVRLTNPAGRNGDPTQAFYGGAGMARGKIGVVQKISSYGFWTNNKNQSYLGYRVDVRFLGNLSSWTGIDCEFTHLALDNQEALSLLKPI